MSTESLNLSDSKAIRLIINEVKRLLDKHTQNAPILLQADSDSRWIVAVNRWAKLLETRLTDFAAWSQALHETIRKDKEDPTEPNASFETLSGKRYEAIKAEYKAFKTFQTTSDELDIHSKIYESESLEAIRGTHGLLPDCFNISASELKEAIRGMFDSNYEISPSINSVCCNILVAWVTAEVISFRKSIAAEDLIVMEYHWGQLVWFTEVISQFYRRRVPRSRATSLRQREPRTRKQQRRAKVAAIARKFEGTGSLSRHVYNELSGTTLAASMETIRNDLRALEGEGKIPKR